MAVPFLLVRRAAAPTIDVGMATTATINGLPPAVWWENALTEGILGRSGLTVEEALDKYWLPDIYLRVGPKVYDRRMVARHLKAVRNVEDIRCRVKHACYDGEYFAAVHTVKGETEKGEYELEVLAFASIEDGRLAWLKELLWFVRGEETSWENQFDGYAVDLDPKVEARDVNREPRKVRNKPVKKINGLAPDVWFLSSLNEGVRGTTGLTSEEALDKYWVPDFYCQSGPPVHVSDRKTLVWHLDWVRKVPQEIQCRVPHACFDGEYFAAVHTIEGTNPSGADYEVEELTFAKIEDGRISWLKALHWYVRGEETTWSHEFDDYPVVETSAEPEWMY